MSVDWDYEYVGRLEDYQIDKYTIIWNEDEVVAFREQHKIDDMFRYYLVEIVDGEYHKIMGITGLHMDSGVYEYTEAVN